MRKFAVVSIALPPSQSGQSVVLYHLLKKIDPSEYCLITQKNFHLYRNQGNCSVQLPTPYYFLHPDYQVTRVITAVAGKLHWPALLGMILKLRVRQITRILERERPQAVVACTADLYDPPASFIASKALGIPFILYIFDYYSFQGTGQTIHDFAGHFEEILVRGASGVIVSNECMRDAYRERYHVDATIIRNPFDIDEYHRSAGCTPAENLAGMDKENIVYTGAIYDAHYDAFRNLLSAIRKTGNRYTLHLYTPQSPRHLVENDITGPGVVVHEARPMMSIPAIQKGAHVLFLPLSFNPELREIIRTSAPAKIGEYLASERPILVHAPEDSFISWYFRKYRCGLVVDENDTDQLAKALERLSTDENLRRELTLNACERAKTDLDVSVSRKRFLAMIEKASQGS